MGVTLVRLAFRTSGWNHASCIDARVPHTSSTRILLKKITFVLQLGLTCTALNPRFLPVMILENYSTQF